MIATADVTPIAAVEARAIVSVRATVTSVMVMPADAAPSLVVTVRDDSGSLELVFLGRRHIPGIVPGATVKATGRVGAGEALARIINPAYELS